MLAKECILFRQMMADVHDTLKIDVIDPSTRQKVGTSEDDDVICEQIENFDIQWVKPAKFRDDAQYFLVRIDLDRGDIALAELGIERLIDNHPKSEYRPLAQFHLGRTLFEMGDYGRAMEVLTSVAENYDDFDQRGDALSLIASIHFENTDYERAHEIFSELNEKGDNEARKWEGLIGMARSVRRPV